ncbi:hypothetical protein C8T65DRAFT_579563 [Cerioporus squamosus]|nr:hypothetical protein C8T65DRAFT_579563 [Cerioporus squamosus]
MQSPDRKLAEGDDLVTIYTPLFCDDVSGARSKQYQKHINVYFQNWSLPNRLQRSTNSVHFLSTSQVAGSSKQLAPILSAVKKSRTNPIRCYNAATHRFCRFRLLVPFLPADNPQQSEECSHAGKNCKCRRCKKGGTADARESDEGYDRLYHANLRTVDETRQIVEEQIRLASYGVEAPIGKLQTETGIKDKVASHWIERLLANARQMKIDHPTRSADDISAHCLSWLTTQTTFPMNPLLDVPHLDPHRDTPVELLHTWLLGVVKYIWHMLHTSWTDAQRDLFAIRLQDVDTDGLNIPPIRAAYMVQYRNNLVGKHFKTIAQTLAFKIHGIATPQQRTLVRTMGELSAILWVTEIADMKTHLVCIPHALSGFLTYT